MAFSEIDDRIARAKARYSHFFSGIVPEEKMTELARATVMPEEEVEFYVRMSEQKVITKEERVIEPISRREFNKVMREIREGLGYPDFRHKMWRRRHGK